MITPNQSSHWYTPEGKPAYDATLRDARKTLLYPSVTQVIGLIAKPSIEAWAVNLMSETCYHDQPWHDEYDMNAETLEEYRERIEPIYKARRMEAAERGSAIHDYAEAIVNGSKAEQVKGYESHCEALKDWIQANIGKAVTEIPFSVNVNGVGYGGRIDAYGWLKDGRRFILDFKTQGVKKYPAYYDEWKWQLAAYRMAKEDTAVLSLGLEGMHLDTCRPVCMSVVINTNEPCIYTKEYSEDQMSDAWDQFYAILKTWYAIKKL